MSDDKRILVRNKRLTVSSITMKLMTKAVDKYLCEVVETIMECT